MDSRAKRIMVKLCCVFLIPAVSSEQNTGGINHGMNGLMTVVIWKQMLVRINCLSLKMKYEPQIKILIERL